MFRTLLALGLLLLLVAMPPAAGPARADSHLTDWSGTLTSQLLEPLPEEPVFDVEIYDDTRENMAFREHFLAALRKYGRKTAADAPLEISFATGIAWSSKRAKELVRRKERLQPRNFEEATFPIDAWRAEAYEYSGLLFGARQSAGIPVQDAKHDRLDITAQVRDRRTARVLWQAELTMPLLAPDRPRIARSIVGPIIEAIGESVENRTFDIR